MDQPVESAKDAVDTAVDTATETIQGASEIPADVADTAVAAVENVGTVSKAAFDDLTGRVVKLEGAAGDVARDAVDVPASVVEDVVEPDPVANVAVKPDSPVRKFHNWFG